MNVALLLSGGTGTRIGSDIPKQYMEAGGRPIIVYCMETLFLHRGIDAVQIVADGPWRELLLGWVETLANGKCPSARDKFRGFSDPGANRQLSICNGLADIRQYAEETDYVLIHDAARPRLSERLITACLDAVRGHDGVLPALPMKDTVYRSGDGATVTSLVDREQIYAGQAPELFRLGPYEAANRALLPDRIRTIHGSTEPAVLAGMDIAMIPGDEENFKITTAADLDRFRELTSRVRHN